MPVVAKRNLSRGVVTPELRVNVGQEAYQTGLAICENWYVKKTGSVRNRPGLDFESEIKDSQNKARLVGFDYGAGDSFSLEFGDQYIRFNKNGMTVREPARLVEGITQANPGVITITAHGLLTGQWVYFDKELGTWELNRRYFKVLKLSADTFSLQNMIGQDIDTTSYRAFVGGGEVSRVYEITSPYTLAQLPFLRYAQSFDVLKLAHFDQALRDLTRRADTNWTLGASTLLPSISAPTGLTAGSTGSTGSYCVTAVDRDTLSESLASSTVTSNSTTPTLTWNAVTNAGWYFVYKKKSGRPFGLIGRAEAVASPTFVDNNITANEAINPPATRDSITGFSLALSKLATASFPLAALAGAGLCMDWNPAGDLLAVGNAASPYIYVFKWDGQTFTLLATMANAPGAQVNVVKWSHNGNYLAVGVSGGEYGYVYKLNGTTLTKVTISAGNRPTGNTFGADWSPDDKFLVWAHATSPFATLQSRSGDTFTKIALADPPTAQGNAVAFLPFSPGTDFWLGSSGIFYYGFIVGHNSASSRSISVYGLTTGFAWARITTAVSAADMPGSDVKALDLSPDANVLFAGISGANYLVVFSRTGSVFAKVTDPSTMPDGQVNSIAVSPDGVYVALGTDGTANLMVYERAGATLTYKNIVTSDLAGDGNGVAWNPTGDFLGGAHDGSPYANIYTFAFPNPGVVGFAQQRLRLGKLKTRYDLEIDSQQGDFTNFTQKTPSIDSDSVTFRPDGNKFNELMHFVNLHRMLQLTSSGVVLIQGDGAGTLTPYAQNPRMISYNGASHVRPVELGDTVIYSGANQNTVFDLKREVETDIFTSIDLTIEAAHLFRGNKIVAMAYQQNPDSVVYLVLDNGQAVAMTYERSQKIIGFGLLTTDGEFEDVVCCREASGFDAVTFTVKRTIGGRVRRYKERLQRRDVTDVRDHKFLDSCVSYDGRPPEGAQLTLSGGPPWESATLLATCTKPFFQPDDEDDSYPNRLKVLDDDGNAFYFEIDEVISPYQANVISGADTIPAELKDLPLDDFERQGTCVRGLWHLEGQTVGMVADGLVTSSPLHADYQDSENTVVTPVVVTNGIAALYAGASTRAFGEYPGYATVIHAGLPYLCDLETLELDTANGGTLADKNKRTDRVIVKVNQTKGLFFGDGKPSPDPGTSSGLNRYENSHDVIGGAVVELSDKEIEAKVQGASDRYGKVFVRQVDPAPAEILAIFPSVKI